MLYNNEYLYIHIPRTAGKCVKSAIIPFMEKPIYLSQRHIKSKFFNKNHFHSINKFLVHSSLEEIQALKSKDHWENMIAKYCNNKNKYSFLARNYEEMFVENQPLPNLKEIKTIIVCLRSPLERAKSLYKFDVFCKNIKTKFNFEEYTEKRLGNKNYRFLRNTKSFVTINSKIHKNIQFIRFNNLEKDLCKIFNVARIDIENKKHNATSYAFKNEKEKTEFYKVKNIKKVIANINKWEEWAIQEGLLSPAKEEDFYALQ